MGFLKGRNQRNETDEKKSVLCPADKRYPLITQKKSLERNLKKKMFSKNVQVFICATNVKHFKNYEEFSPSPDRMLYKTWAESCILTKKCSLYEKIYAYSVDF